MNNKGMTIVELIVTFSLLLVIVIGMFNLIMDVKVELDNKQIAKDFTEYSSTINNQIHHDLINNKPVIIMYKNSVSDSEQTCINLYEYNLCEIFDIKNYCENIYPCVVYGYYENSSNKTRTGKAPTMQTIALNISPSNETYSKYGIYYDNVFEPIPDQDYVVIGNTTIIGDDEIKTETPSIKYDETSKLFIIDFPYYIVDNDKNYGFKIVYPFG